MAFEPRRITLVADELLGYTRTGGIGTATSFLALALARIGHQVEVVYTGASPGELAREWAERYAEVAVRIRVLQTSDRRVEPAFFARMLSLEDALAADPPDVVIAQDLAAPAYTALRMRRLGLAFPKTLFVLYCHGGRRWITDTARKVRVLPGAHAITLLEQACVELADVVVAPSRYLLDWMRGERWELPSRAFVIPYVNRSAALGEEAPPPPSSNGQRVQRLAFFGRLEDRKGIAQFIAALNSLPEELLRNVEVDFVGRATRAWTPARVHAELFAELRNVSFATDLDQAKALERLSRPGTLAVMPSLGETFSNAVYECLECGIPFLASDAGAPRELVDPADHERVLFEPTTEGVTTALRRALRNGNALRPARPAFDARAAVDRWAEVVRLEPHERPVEHPTGELELLIGPQDEPADGLVETLRSAQAASGADAVTCGVRLPDGSERLFLGDPGGLGLLANHYGTVALVRSELLREGEATWPLLARLSLEGARIVSIPRALASTNGTPGDVKSDPASGLRVVEHFERHLPRQLRGLARLTAGLGATPAPRRPQSLIRRVLRR